jgi:hypothetical protein
MGSRKELNDCQPYIKCTLHASFERFFKEFSGFDK